MRRRLAVAAFLCTAVLATGCQDRADPPPTNGRAAAFGRTVAGLLLDTTLYELRGTLMRKVVNSNRDEEAPLADSLVANVAPPGAHLHDGVMHADIAALTAILGRRHALSIEGDRVFVGNPPVLIFGHRHGDAFFVPVKPFARQYGAYVDVGCTPANCATIWTADIIAHMRANGGSGSAGVLGAHADGLIDSVDVRNLPRP
ncbi:MAG: hypothetical protein M3303_12590 [Gemmatimonadota bacterium]|nr:hypothetical protein [Gemmatimonadota bacterium]